MANKNLETLTTCVRRNCLITDETLSHLPCSIRQRDACARDITLYSTERIHHVIKEGLIFGRWWGKIYCSNVKAATTPEQSVERDHDPQSLWVRGVRELIALQN